MTTPFLPLSIPRTITLRLQHRVGALERHTVAQKLAGDGHFYRHHPGDSFAKVIPPYAYTPMSAALDRTNDTDVNAVWRGIYRAIYRPRFSAIAKNDISSSGMVAIVACMASPGWLIRV